MQPAAGRDGGERGRRDGERGQGALVNYSPHGGRGGGGCKGAPEAALTDRSQTGPQS